MLWRNFFLLTLTILCLISVSGASLPPPEDEFLARCAEHLKNKDYSAAQSAALSARPSPRRDFVLGVAAYHLKKWSEADCFLATSTDRFAILGDFALYYRAQALIHLSRTGEALALLEKLQKNYADSPFIRPAALLSADIYFQNADFRKALSAYQAFRAQYPGGSDSLSALFRSVLCREKLGDTEEAVRELRRIWLKYPTKTVAGQAGSELKKLRAEGVSVPPFTAEELFERGSILFNRGRYEKAARELSSISPKYLPEKQKGELAFKIAMAHYRLKKNSEAERMFARLASSGSPYREYAMEASYRIAHILDRTGREDDAVTLFLKLAKTSPDSPLADDALYYAAIIRKHAGAHEEAFSLFRKVVNLYPDSSRAPRSLWESGWSLYLSGRYPEAAKTFDILSGDPVWREKALYWKGRSLEASGSRKAALSVYSEMQREFPAGFYTLNIEKETEIPGAVIPALGTAFHPSLPEPRDMGRAKALIALGLHQEAAMELAAAKKRNRAVFRGSLAHAGLYLSINDYRSAMGLFKTEDLQKNNESAASVWAVLFPAAFRNIVSHHTAEVGIDESLVYALMRAESNFLPTARSPVGAVGLMQLMPATARGTAKSMGPEVSASRLTNPETNIRIGIRHLKDLIVRFNGNLVSVVAAYNAGSSRVIRWRKEFPNLKEDEFIENIPYTETREYVKKVLSAREIYRRLYAPEKPFSSVISSPFKESPTSTAAPKPMPHPAPSSR